MTKPQKIDMVIKLLQEITSSQSLGQSCSNAIDVSEEDMIESIICVKSILKDIK